MEKITVEVLVQAPIEKVWEFWTNPIHIMQWNNASDDWHTPSAENNLTKGGKFTMRMEAKDGSFGFDFGGEYTAVQHHEIIQYVLEDNRAVKIEFSSNGADTKVVETFEAESENSLELQQAGWQAILNNFKKYVENN